MAVAAAGDPLTQPPLLEYPAERLRRRSTDACLQLVHVGTARERPTSPAPGCSNARLVSAQAGLRFTMLPRCAQLAEVGRLGAHTAVSLMSRSVSVYPSRVCDFRDARRSENLVPMRRGFADDGVQSSRCPPCVRPAMRLRAWICGWSARWTIEVVLTWCSGTGRADGYRTERMAGQHLGARVADYLYLAKTARRGVGEVGAARQVAARQCTGTIRVMPVTVP